MTCSVFSFTFDEHETCLLVFLPALLLEPLGTPIPRRLGPSVIKFLKTPLARVSWTSWDMHPFLATPLFTIWSLTYHHTVVCCPKSSVDSKQFLNSLTCAVVKAAKFCCLAIPDSLVSLLIGVYGKLMPSTLCVALIHWMKMKCSIRLCRLRDHRPAAHSWRLQAKTSALVREIRTSVSVDRNVLSTMLTHLSGVSSLSVLVYKVECLSVCFWMSEFVLLPINLAPLLFAPYMIDILNQHEPVSASVHN